MLHNFRLRTPKGTPKGSSDLWSHPVLLLRKKRGKKPGMRGTYFRSGPFPELRIPKGTPKGSSDLWSHPVLLLRKKRGKKPGMRRTYFRYGTLPERASSGHVTDVTSGHVTDFTSGHVTSGSTSQHLRKYDLSCTHILLTSLCDFWVWRVTIENFVQIFRIFLVL